MAATPAAGGEQEIRANRRHNPGTLSAKPGRTVVSPVLACLMRLLHY